MSASASIPIILTNIISVPSFSSGPFVGSGSSTESELQLRYQAEGEVIFAVSYRKIKLKTFNKTQKASLQRERNWLRPWAKRHLQEGIRSEGSGSVRTTEEMEDEEARIGPDDGHDSADVGPSLAGDETVLLSTPVQPQQSMPGSFEPLTESANTLPSQTPETSPTQGTGSISARQAQLPRHSQEWEGLGSFGAPPPPPPPPNNYRAWK